MDNNDNFNYGEFAIIKSQAGLNSYKISVKEWVNGWQRQMLSASKQLPDVMAELTPTRTSPLSLVCRLAQSLKSI